MQVNWGNVAQWAAVVVAVLGLFGFREYLQRGSITRWIIPLPIVAAIGLILILIWRYLAKNAGRIVSTLSAVVVIATSTTVAIALLLYKLPTTTTRISEVVKKEGYIIAQKTKEDIFKDVREDHEKIITTLADSEAVRKVVYIDALDQAKKRGYIFLNERQYLTAYDRRENNRLLTERQRKAIEECFTKHIEEDLYSLMFSVLSDKEVIEALKCEATFVHLTPYEVVGVVGGYLSELRLEHTKLRNQVPKSAPS
jgi:NADH:ubiquinone oxidoreductase subunit K